jgi:trk system potassium uptake protein TrkH
MPITRLRRRLATLLGRLDPLHTVVLGYLLYCAIGFVALVLPIAHTADVDWQRHLFMAVSAVSTTGLATHDVGTSYSAFGEVALLLMMQAGGLGYLTLGSFVVVAVSNRMARRRADITRAAYGLPADFDVPRFIRRVVIFTLSIQAAGALALWPQFAAAGVESPIWQSVFHAVSAFSTTGLSLFPTSFEGYRDQPGILLTVSVLAWAGALGFLVLSETVDVVRRELKRFGFTTTVALVVTLAYTVVGTGVMLAFEPSVRALPADQQVINALFMVMAAGTTSGFNSLPVGALAPAVILMLFVIMMFGASPGGTGGGLKSSALAVLFALVASTLRRRRRVTLLGFEIPPDKVQQATASLAFYMLFAGLAMFGLLLSEPDAGFMPVMFEAMSALSGIGMSMGLTANLSEAGLWITMALMLIGRIGILAFGLALAVRARDAEHDPEDADILI